jgi:hypothetical protein
MYISSLKSLGGEQKNQDTSAVQKQVEQKHFCHTHFREAKDIIYKHKT